MFTKDTRRLLFFFGQHWGLEARAWPPSPTVMIITAGVAEAVAANQIWKGDASGTSFGEPTFLDCFVSLREKGRERKRGGGICRLPPVSRLLLSSLSHLSLTLVVWHSKPCHPK